jgi:SNF2 family DNA or RNA helicase
MGQAEHVMVHRMLARECIDERMVKRLAEKQGLFDRNVRDSELKNASADATERRFIREVIDEERARLGLSGVGARTDGRDHGPA